MSSPQLDPETGVETVMAALGEFLKGPKPVDEVTVRNVRRAFRLRSALEAFERDAESVREPIETVISDLLTDLLHLVALMPDASFEGLLERAYLDWAAESAGLD